jgi:two-component system chemotaxis sensor kinase CheA
VLRALPARAGGPTLVPGRVVRAAGRTGELLRRLEADVERLATAMDGDARLLAQTAGPLDDDVRRVRMLPFAEGCVGLERTVHDLGRAAGKEVALVVQGGDVELDRAVIEGLKDPLRHLVRNAVDHGMEPPDARRAAGRPAQGRITVSAALRGAHVEVTVSDDGRGLDLARLAERARAAGLPVPGDARELARLVFEPGVSTAYAVTDVSGRGVGLDVVKTRIESLHGTADVAAGAGQGARFTLTVPLTLTMLNVLLVAAGGRTFALASASVGNLLRLGPGDLRVVCGREMLPRGGALVPVVRLADALGVGALGTPNAGGKAPAVVLAAGEQRVAFVVDELVATQDVVVKALGRRLRRVSAVSGATILPSGRVALVLNAAHLIRRALGGTPSARLAGPTPGAVPARKRVLLADDSLTTRALERSLLEAAGYDVVVAVDGTVAWRVLQDDVPDLVVSDVEMPGMDGFALTEAIRSSPRLRDLPVVLLTGHERTEDKARGLRAGASAYLVKSAFDQKAFLDTLARLL